MTKLFFSIVVAFFILIVLFSCNKAVDLQPGIVGLWEKRIACGFRFPCTNHDAGNGNRVEFMKSGVVNFYENGKVTLSKSYKVVKTGDCKMPEEFWFLKYSDKKDIDDAITIRNDTLRISGFICGADGPIDTYVRIR